MSPIILPSELKNLPTENLVILDARAGKDVYHNYLEKHLKGARFIDLDKDLAEIGENAAFGGGIHFLELKICRNTFRTGDFRKIPYHYYDDKNGANAAARAWWMLKAFGFENVQVLDGGFQNAEKQNVEFSSGEETFEKAEIIKEKIGFFRCQRWKRLKMN